MTTMTAKELYSKNTVTTVITVIVVTNKRKDLSFMRSKTQGINVRVTPDEKEKAQRKRILLWTFSVGISQKIGAWKERKSRNRRENLQDF